MSMRLKKSLSLAAIALSSCGTAAASEPTSTTSPTTVAPTTTKADSSTTSNAESPLAVVSGAGFSSVNWQSMSDPEYHYSRGKTTKIVSVSYVDVSGVHLAIVGYAIAGLASTAPFGAVVYEANTSGTPKLIEVVVTNSGEPVPSGLPVGVSQDHAGLNVAQPFQAGEYGKPTSSWTAVTGNSLRVCPFASSENSPTVANDHIGNFTFNFAWEGSQFVLTSHEMT
jgi:hypothetical protein